MQILQWLFKVAHEEPKQTITTTSPDPKKKRGDDDKKGKSKDIIVVKSSGGVPRRLKKTAETSKLSCEDLNLFRFIYQRRDIAKTCFYSTINLKRAAAGSFQTSCSWDPDLKKKQDSSSGGQGNNNNNRVLPLIINDHANHHQLMIIGNKERIKDKELKEKQAKPKSTSKMKELLRWASANNTKSNNNKKQAPNKHFAQHQGTSVELKKRGGKAKGVADHNYNNDRISTESPKISLSFRWDHHHHNGDTASILDDNLHTIPSTPGYWIKTDSEFVVLEL